LKRKFDIDATEFHRRKRRRIEEMNNNPPPPAKPAPVSTPGIHEIAGYLPGRLEFEHEIDNEAEDLIKDLEVGMCLFWGGNKIPADENDMDVKAREKIAEERKALIAGNAGAVHPTKGSIKLAMNGKPLVNGHHRQSSLNGGIVKSEDVVMINGTKDAKEKDKKDKGKDKDKEEEEEDAEDATLPPAYETMDTLNFKLTLVESYLQRVDKRLEAKEIIFDRQLTDYKKVCQQSL
jgi:transcriptional adapter 2-alpha